MIARYINVFIGYLDTHSVFLGEYFPIIVFMIALLEATPFVGTLIPGTLFLLFFGFSSFNLDISISLTILAATLGSVLGDIMGYYLGRYGSDWLIRHRKLLKANHIERARGFFVNHGVKSIFIGRFIGPIRHMISLLAGSVSMRFSRFMFYDILAAFVWSGACIITGYYFGHQFWKIERFVSRLSIALTLIVIMAAALYFLRPKIVRWYRSWKISKKTHNL